MKTMKNVSRAVLTSFAALLLCVSSTAAGELPLAWNAAGDPDVVAGYEVEVLSADGELLQILDVGPATKAVVTDLADGMQYRFRVRPYDRYGNSADEASIELQTMAKPRIDELDGDVATGDSWVTVRGANFDDRARVMSRSGSFEVLSATVVRHDELVLRVNAHEEMSLEAMSDALLIVNPVKRSTSYLAANPELLDVDGSGAADQGDLELLRAAVEQNEDGLMYSELFDVNGDGQLDELDVETLQAVIEGHRSIRHRIRGS